MELDGIAAESAAIGRFEPRRVCIPQAGPARTSRPRPSGARKLQEPRSRHCPHCSRPHPAAAGRSRTGSRPHKEATGWQARALACSSNAILSVHSPPPVPWRSVVNVEGNAPTAALPPPETPPIDATLMDIATPTPGRLNRAKRLRVLRARTHYIGLDIDLGVSATACCSASAGRAETADMSNRLRSGRRDS